MLSGTTLSFNDSCLPDHILKNLGYDPDMSNPVGIVLNKSSEFYLSLNERIMPYMVVNPGDIFGLARILDHIDADSVDYVSSHLSFFMWELTSGARSIFMLPKITEKGRHLRLKKHYHLSQERPLSYADHWLVFKEIADRNDCSWRSEFLYFSNKWFEKLKDPKWARLYAFLLRSNRRAYGYWRNILSWQVTFNLIEQKKNIRGLSSYTLDTAKHLFAISIGALPGFRPAVDERSAPIKLIQEAYLEGYELKYWPIIMEPSHFGKNPVYYSVSYPTLAQCDPDAFKGKSIISLLAELRSVMTRYQEGIDGNMLAKSTSLYEAARTAEFSFYHDDPTHDGIEDNLLLLKEDPRFSYNQTGEFPQHSQFLRGCIEIALKEAK